MFTKNFTRIVVGQMPAFSGYNLSLKIRDGSTYVAYNNTGINPASITNIVASKLSSLEGNASNSGKATFALGSGTNTDIDKHTLGNLISDTDFTLNSASRTNPASQGLKNKCILSQTITYNGNTEITISEIGLFAIMGNGSACLVAYELLDSPITVNQDDTFTVSMIIG